MPTDLRKLEQRIAALEKVLSNAEVLLKALDGPGTKVTGGSPGDKMVGLEVDALRHSIQEAKKLR
jgi:hypothetical protein